MSDFVRQSFERWFARKYLVDTGARLSEAQLLEMRGPSGDYSGYSYAHGCWIGWQARAAEKDQALAGAA